MNVMKLSCVQRLLSDVRPLLSMEQTLVDVVTPHLGQVRIFGDIHGDIHSLAEAMLLIGMTSDNNVLLVAGDCVDRGSWGCKVFISLFVLNNGSLDLYSCYVAIMKLQGLHVDAVSSQLVCCRTRIVRN